MKVTKQDKKVERKKILSNMYKLEPQSSKKLIEKNKDRNKHQRIDQDTKM